MTRQNPWGENWHNENYSSAEMDELLGRIFGVKCTFMGFLPAGKRKWVRKRSDEAMEVINLQSDGVLSFYAGFGLSFPWIPHGNSKELLWHKTPKSAVMDLNYEAEDKIDWSISKRRTIAAERAGIVSTEVCERCEPWFAQMSNQEKILKELERRRAKPLFYTFVQALTVYQFWQARVGKWSGLDVEAESYLKLYFGEEGFPKLKRLLEQEAAAASRRH